MPAWRVILTPAAQRQIDRLRGIDLLALRGVILALAEDRRPPGVSKLAGADLWRVRVRVEGRPWRIVYQVRTGERLVVITRVVPRDEGTYRRLNGALDRYARYQRRVARCLFPAQGCLSSSSR